MSLPLYSHRAQNRFKPGERLPLWFISLLFSVPRGQMWAMAGYQSGERDHSLRPNFGRWLLV